VALAAALVTAVVTVGVVPSGVAAGTSASPLYGITVNSVRGIAKVTAMERTLPHRPTARVYFDSSEPATYYASAVAQLHAAGGVMGELLDSGEAAAMSASAYQARVEDYVGTLGASVDIWEIGNEVNGNWTGPYAAGADRIAEAYADVAATGSATALTLFANEYGQDNCGDGAAELTPVQYSEQDVPATVREGLTYVFESYYPTLCGSTFPSEAQVAAEMAALHALYPNARLGFGEVGLPRPVTHRSLTTGKAVMAWAYGLDPGLPYYVGGYFWWYALEDAVRGKALLGPSLRDAVTAEATALG
jgi:hypothetical protein